MAAFTDSPEKKTLLIVDDTIPNRLLLRQALSGDYEILEAGDGQTALEILRAAPEISLIILDILMPASDGYGVLEALRADEELRKLPVVVIAGEDMDSQIRAFELGAADVMLHLPRCIRRMCRVRSCSLRMSMTRCSGSTSAAAARSLSSKARRERSRISVTAAVITASSFFASSENSIPLSRFSSADSRMFTAWSEMRSRSPMTWRKSLPRRRSARKRSPLDSPRP